MGVPSQVQCQVTTFYQMPETRSIIKAQSNIPASCNLADQGSGAMKEKRPWEIRVIY